ncbi:MAG: FeoB-associated Cys-rich membrane protein [Armatimonadetes bacterium]|nr:FeoB-associated Cys-rich membrane protein [Armatimonadota bacterium]
MWQDIAVGVIVLAAAIIVVRHLVRTVTARRGCDVDQCANCPFSDGCGHKETEDKSCRNS